MPSTGRGAMSGHVLGARVGVEVLDIIGCLLGLGGRLHEQGRVVAQGLHPALRYAALLSRVALAMPQTPQRYAAPISATSSSFA